MSEDGILSLAFLLCVTIMMVGALIVAGIMVKNEKADKKPKRSEPEWYYDPFARVNRRVPEDVSELEKLSEQQRKYLKK